MMPETSIGTMHQCNRVFDTDPPEAVCLVGDINTIGDPMYCRLIALVGLCAAPVNAAPAPGTRMPIQFTGVWASLDISNGSCDFDKYPSYKLTQRGFENLQGEKIFQKILHLSKDGRKLTGRFYNSIGPYISWHSEDSFELSDDSNHLTWSFQGETYNWVRCGPPIAPPPNADKREGG
jgi:hypothetical protein